MKTILLILIISPLFCQAQKITQKILKAEVGHFDCNYSRVIDKGTDDTAYYVFMGFQNLKYSSIVDTKSLFFTKKEHFEKFIADLDSAALYINNKSVEINWEGGDYSIYKWTDAKTLYVYEMDTEGYTSLNEKQLTQLLVWLKQIDFGKDEVISN